MQSASCPPLPADLKALVENKSTNIQTVLNHPQIMKYGDSQYRGFQAYMTHHASALLDLAMSYEVSVATSVAYRLLAIGTGEYFKPTIESGLFLEKANAAVSGRGTPEHIVGRVATMTRNALILCPDLSPNLLPFLSRLMPHCGNRSVLGLFEALTDEDIRLEVAQKWLAKLGWFDAMQRDICNFDVDHQSTDPFRDVMFNKAEYTFRLIARACDPPVLSKFVQTPEIMAAVSRQFNHAPNFVKNSQWRALVKLVSKDTLSESLNLVPVACRMIMEKFDKLIEYRVLVINFLTKIIGLSKASFGMISDAHVPQIMVSLLSRFQESTVLHAAFLSFLEMGLKMRGFPETAIYFYVPAVIVFSEFENNRVMKLCCIKVMEMLTAAAATDRKARKALHQQHNVDEFMSNVVKPYRDKVNNNYGGFNAINELGFLRNMLV